MRTFLWSKKGTSKGYHLIKWSQLYTSMDKGRLGIKQVQHMNTALLAKWGWRFSKEKTQLWFLIIEEKYGPSPTSWFPKATQSTYGHSCWRHISACIQTIRNLYSFMIHSSSKISFWYDIWQGSKPLKAIALALFKLSTAQSGSIADFIVQSTHGKD
ncbi:hypothetical protein BVC80_8805g5 [Macleaya cordata]|uniref:Reverse transcriptase zinc-binding domain n=1 Tax=Macleaya cordata TaxID=56857 RepID=A0A200R7Y4_MACCD|nr:hypothetical protein BVC80_8805g5 [Macleaya cordata]